MKLLRIFLRENYGGTYIEYAMIGLILTLATMSFVTALMAALQDQEANAVVAEKEAAGVVQLEKPAKSLPAKKEKPAAVSD